MDRARHLRNYDMHSWAGITLGLIVYIVCFSGSFALFDQEIKTWEDPALRLSVSETPAEMDQVFADWIEETTGGAEAEFMRFDFPTEYAPFYQGMVQYHDENDEHVFEQQRWNANTGAPVALREGGLSEWLLDFHRDFMWPDILGGRTVGRSLVGIVGIVLMLAILSGIIAHTKIREEAYSMRLKRSQRLKWQDTHKVVGIWGLPFYIMIAFTGAYLGVIVIVSQLIAAVAFKGDVDRLVGAVLGPVTEATGEQVQMISLDELREMQHPSSGKDPYMVIMRNYGDAAAEFDVFYKAADSLRFSDVLYISGVTGEPSPPNEFREETGALRVANAVTPLHYGTYGGIWLKYLYFALGMSLAVITALGSMMWIERRKHGNDGEKTLTFYNRLGYFNTGIVMGLPVATIAIFYLDKLYVGAEAGRIFATGWTFFGVWTLGFIYAWMRRDDYKTTRELLIATGVMAMGIPILNGLATGQWFPAHLGADHSVAAWVDVVMLLAGAATAAMGYLSPAERLDKAARRAKTKAAAATAMAEKETAADQEAAAVPAE
ncbi:MAG: PepSY-associated TM helix domain-containing protein [Pseudomonadota bacterium]